MENNNNLFTNMFGIESEEPQLEPEPVSKPIENQIPSPIPSPIPIEQPTESTQQQVNQEIIVLDSNKPLEQTQVQSEPVQHLSNMNYTAKPATPMNYQEMDTFAPAKEINYKVICIILVVTLIAVLGAFFLYTGLDSYLENNSSNNNEQSEQKPVEENKQEEPKEEPKAPTTPTTPITFDMTLSFDKGYTTKQHEFHQTQAYKPEASEGVIKCETIRKISDPNIGTAKVIVYIYYKDYMTKKLLSVNEWDLINSKIYNEFLIRLQTINSALSENEHLYTQMIVDKKNYLIDYYMLADLAYNQATNIPDSNYYIDVKLSYNAAIKNAMNKFLLDQRYSGNMYCSTLETSQASI